MRPCWAVREFLLKARLPEDLLMRKVPNVTVPEYYWFMEAIQQLSPDGSTIIKLGAGENIETFSPPIFAAYCSSAWETVLWIDRIQMAWRSAHGD